MHNKIFVNVLKLILSQLVEFDMGENIITKPQTYYDDDDDSVTEPVLFCLGGSVAVNGPRLRPCPKLFHTTRRRWYSIRHPWMGCLYTSYIANTGSSFWYKKKKKTYEWIEPGTMRDRQPLLITTMFGQLIKWSPGSTMSAIVHGSSILWENLLKLPTYW